MDGGTPATMPKGLYDIQHQIRQNSMEIQNYLHDLGEWTSTVKRKDSALKSGKAPAGDAALNAPAAPPAALPPVRGRVASVAKSPSQPASAKAAPPRKQKAPTAAGAPNAAGHTYDYFRDKWDKFDVDAALAEASGSEDEAEASDKGGPAAHPAVVAARKASRAGRGGGGAAGPDPQAAARDAEAAKTHGNELFNAGDYGEAVVAYGRSLELKPTCVAFANRAMARLKLGDMASAESDCTAALGLDSGYVKAYVRRGAARRGLGRPLDAALDFEHALRLEPANRTFSEERQGCVVLVEAELGLSLHHPQVDLPIREAQPAAADAAASADTGPSQPAKPQAVPPAPRTSVDFEVAWKSLADDQAARAQYLASLNPAELPALFKECLAPPLLLSVVQALLTATTSAQALGLEQGVALLGAFSRLPRFAICSGGWGKQQKLALRELWARSGLEAQGDLLAAYGLPAKA